MTEPRAQLPSRIAPTPYLFLTLTILSWGGNVVAAKLALGEISYMALVCLRWLVVCVLVFAWAGKSLVPAIRELRPHWRFMLIMGILGYTASNALMFEGARYTSGINIALIPAVMPVLVIVGARFAYGAPISAVRAAGVLITLSGILVIATRGDLSTITRLEFNRGDLLSLAGAITYATFTLGLRYRPPVSTFSTFIGMAIAAFLTSLPLMLIEIAMGEFIAPGPRGLAVLLYVALFTSIVGHVLWIKAVSMIGPSRAGVFQNLVPVVGAFFAVVFLQERFEWFHTLSLAMVLGGIFVSERMGR